MQRLLTLSEEADFLSRHTIEAARVAETKAFLVVGSYDQILSPPAWYQYDINIGLIPPVGDEVDDSAYGRVIIFPAPNGEIYFNADVPANVDTTINQPQVPGSPGAPAGGPPPPTPDPFAGLVNVLVGLGILFVVLETRPWRN